VLCTTMCRLYARASVAVFLAWVSPAHFTTSGCTIVIPLWLIRSLNRQSVYSWPRSRAARPAPRKTRYGTSHRGGGRWRWPLGRVAVVGIEPHLRLVPHGLPDRRDAGLRGILRPVQHRHPEIHPDLEPGEAPPGDGPPLLPLDLLLLVLQPTRPRVKIVLADS
jgi:hypothetical protein